MGIKVRQALPAEASRTWPDDGEFESLRAADAGAVVIVGKEYGGRDLERTSFDSGIGQSVLSRARRDAMCVAR